jgi:hypothetical protein
MRNRNYSPAENGQEQALVEHLGLGRHLGESRSDPLGHSNMTKTMIYACPPPEHLDKVLPQNLMTLSFTTRRD